MPVTTNVTDMWTLKDFKEDEGSAKNDGEVYIINYEERQEKKCFDQAGDRIEGYRSSLFLKGNGGEQEIKPRLCTGAEIKHQWNCI